MVTNRWLILGILCVARFGLGFQFQSVGSVAPFLIEDFGIDYSQIGTLVGLFMLPGIVLAVPAGFIGKRFGDKRVVSAGILLMIFGGVVSGVADNFNVLALGRVISGFGAAFLFVLMTKMLTDWFADKELFLAMSLFIIGWPVGIAAAQAIQVPIAEQTSWNMVFHFAAIGMVLGLVAIAGFYRPPCRARGAEQVISNGLSAREIWLVCVVGAMWMLVNGAYLVILSFGPTLLREQGSTVAESSLVVSVMSWVFFFALPLGGYLATRFSAPNIIMVLGMVGTVIVGTLIPYTSIPLVTFAVFGIAFAIAVPVIGSLPAEVLRPENRGPGFGIYQVWYFVGSALFPIAGGVLKDWTGSASACLLFSAALMLATLCLLGLLRFEQRRLPAR
jgi:MFS family permease